MTDAPLPLLPEHFELRGKLGSGGMATVYLAFDQRVRQEVALKILHPHLREDPLIVERFRREITAARRLNHPNVVGIYDLIETPSVACLVLEYHAGADLKYVLRRDGAFGLESACSLISQVLSALALAHREGVIHRDIKPHNVLVDDEGRVKLADFGLARVDDLIGVTTHTMTLGTPEYMAPELLGDSVVDGRVDLYSVGVMFFELLTNALPFRADTPLALLQLHQNASPPDPKELVSDLPQWVTRFTQRAMSKNPEDRFSTAEEMLEALRAKDNASQNRATLPEEAIATENCASCGASLLLNVSICLECGHERLRIHRQPKKGHRVIVKSKFSGKGDFLTFQEKNQAIETLKALGGQSKLTDRQIDHRLRHPPFALADHLNRADAELLSDTLAKHGVRNWHCTNSVYSRITFFMGFLGFYAVLLLICILAFIVFTFSLLDGEVDSIFGVFITGAIAGVTLHEHAKRSRALFAFDGEAGGQLTDNVFIQRCVKVFLKIRSTRLKSLLRRIISRGLSLQKELKRRAVRDELSVEVDRALEAALLTAERTAKLEHDIGAATAAEIHEAMERLDVQISTADILDTSDLLEEKMKLRAQLAERDEKQSEIARASHRLLEVSARLSGLAFQAHELQQFDEESLTSMSMVLENIHLELAAHQEIERDLRGLPPVEEERLEEDSVVEVAARGHADHARRVDRR